MQATAQHQSSLVQISHYHCGGAAVVHPEEEAALVHEIAFVRRGAFIRRDARGEVFADASQVLFFTRGRPYQIAHPLPGSDESTVFTLPDSLLHDLLNGSNWAYEPALDDPFPLGYATVFPAQRLLLHRLMRLADQRENSDALRVDELALGLLSALLAGLSPLTRPTVQPQTIEAHRDLVNQVRRTLAEHFSEPLRLEQIAQAVGGSPYWLSRIFRAETGLSIHRYLLHLRLSHALERLAESPRAPLAELALELGFHSHSHFSTAFWQAFGLTPSEFRDQARGVQGWIVARKSLIVNR